MNRVVQDPSGGQWWVQAGDPGWEIVHRNLLAGRTLIVLPLETLVRGVSVHPERVTEHLRKMQTAYAVTDDPAFAEAIVRGCALFDCLTI